ncbi:MAG: response regulator transcription factor, partial [Verrucomicrobiota bacterium]
MTRNTTSEARILIVEDDQGLAELLQDEIEDAGFVAHVVHTAEDALSTVHGWMPDVIVSDLRLPGADGLELLNRVRGEMPEGTPDVLIIT